MISSLLIKYCNLLFVFLLILNVFTVIYLARNISLPPVLSNDLFAIHYTTNVDFTKDMADYHEMFDTMKEYYENETYFEKYEKYKIKLILKRKILFLKKKLHIHLSFDIIIKRNFFYIVHETLKLGKIEFINIKNKL